MIKILAIHNTNLTDEEYREKLFKRYPSLSEYEGMYRVYITNYSKGKKIKIKKFDKFYYDEKTIKVQDIWDKYIAKNIDRDPQIFAISFDKKKMKTEIIKKIKNR